MASPRNSSKSSDNGNERYRLELIGLTSGATGLTSRSRPSTQKARSVGSESRAGWRLHAFP